MVERDYIPVAMIEVKREQDDEYYVNACSICLLLHLLDLHLQLLGLTNSSFCLRTDRAITDVDIPSRSSIVALVGTAPGSKQAAATAARLSFLLSELAIPCL